MSLGKEEIEKIAWLARLALDEDDIPSYSRDLSNILAMVEQLNAIDIKNIEPLAHPLEIKARLRNDAINEIDQREKFQNIAPAVKNGHYLVPKVLE